jgi:hypothetical protein
MQAEFVHTRLGSVLNCMIGQFAVTSLLFAATLVKHVSCASEMGMTAGTAMSPVDPHAAGRNVMAQLYGIGIWVWTTNSPPAFLGHAN